MVSLTRQHMGVSVAFQPVHCTAMHMAAVLRKLLRHVPAGAPIAFTATAAGFAPGSAALPPLAGSTTPRMVPLAPVVTCHDT